MDIRKLQRAIVEGLEDVKAQNIVVFNTEALSALFERVIIASGTSNRQTKALAASVRDAVKALGEPVPRMEGEENGEWIIVDCGAAVAHIMQPSIRDYYHLEEIWGMTPVALKSAVKKARAGLPKAEEPEAKPAKKSSAVVAKKARAKADSARAPASRPRAAKSEPASGSQLPAAARKTAAKSARPPAADRKPAARTTATSAPKKTAAAGSRKPAAKAPAARRPKV